MAITAFKQVANNAQSTLAEDLTNVETDIDVASGHGSRFPSPGNGFYATIWDADTYADPGLDPNMEVVLCTARSTDTLTVTRGQRGTSGVTHLTGNAIRLLVDSTAVSDLQTAVNAVEAWSGTSGFRAFTDCAHELSSSYPSDGWLRGATGGTAPALDTTNATTSHPGVWRLDTSTSASGTSYLCYGGSPDAAITFLLGGGSWAFEIVVYIPTLSDGSNEYALRLGFGDQNTADFTNGVYFEYDRTASVNWRICTANASTRTKTSSGVAVAATTWTKLRFEVNAGGTSVAYYINGSSVGTVTTNIPLTNRWNPRLTLIKSAGSTARQCDIDMVTIDHSLTTTR